MDAIVGGGGLIQTPVILMVLPQYPVATLLGTTKFPSFCGTLLALIRYMRHVEIAWKIMASAVIIAFLSSMLGSASVSYISNQQMKPIILVCLIGIAIYTFLDKNFGSIRGPEVSIGSAIKRSVIFSFVIGFYDGFIGPGTGSFLIIAFISLLGQDFMHASAHAKIINLATNIGSIFYFGLSGHILFAYAIPMAVFNLLGAALGSQLAIKKGNKFIRMFFLGIIVITILKFGFSLLVPVK